MEIKWNKNVIKIVQKIKIQLLALILKLKSSEKKSNFSSDEYD